MRLRFLAALLLLPLLAQAQLYRWVDETGKVHYSDRVPESGAKNIEKKALAAAPGSSPLPYALQQAVENFPVELYTSDACKDTCAQARALLDKRGVPYKEYTVVDQADIDNLKKLSGGSSVPVLTVGKEVYKGFEPGIFKTALDTAGYPATSLLPPGTQARTPAPKPANKPAAGTGGTPAAPASSAEGTPALPATEAASAPKTPQ
jgi:glutaredoxin